MIAKGKQYRELADVKHNVVLVQGIDLAALETSFHIGVGYHCQPSINSLSYATCLCYCLHVPPLYYLPLL